MWGRGVALVCSVAAARGVRGEGGGARGWRSLRMRVLRAPCSLVTAAACACMRADAHSERRACPSLRCSHAAAGRWQVASNREHLKPEAAGCRAEAGARRTVSCLSVHTPDRLGCAFLGPVPAARCRGPFASLPCRPAALPRLPDTELPGSRGKRQPPTVPHAGRTAPCALPPPPPPPSASPRTRPSRPSGRLDCLRR